MSLLDRIAPRRAEPAAAVVAGSTVTIRDIGAADQYAGERPRLLDRTCVATDGLSPSDPGYLSGPLLCGEETLWFYEVAVDPTEPAP